MMNDSFLKLKQIKIKDLSFNSGIVQIDDLFDAIEKFTDDLDETCMVYITNLGYDNVGLIATRYETEEEYNDRVEKRRSALLKEQKEKNRSWAIQKLKFQRARSRKDKKTAN